MCVCMSKNIVICTERTFTYIFKFLPFLHFIYFLIGKQSLYNFVLVFALQKDKCIIIIYFYIPSLPSLLLLPPSHPLACHRMPGWAPCVMYQPPTILHVIVYIGQCHFFNSSHPHLPLLCPQLHSLLGSSVPFF